MRTNIIRHAEVLSKKIEKKGGGVLVSSSMKTDINQIEMIFGAYFNYSATSNSQAETH